MINEIKKNIDSLDNAIKRNKLPLPPNDLINPSTDEIQPPIGQFWIYTCPHCGGKMSTYEVWDSITPAPIVCSGCGYTIYPKAQITTIN